MAAVLWKILVKGWPGATRFFVLALALLLCATTLGEAAEPADTTIVLQLQLPPSTSPETVRGLIADLAAKGAHPVTQPTATSEVAAQPVFNAANVAIQAWKGSKQAVQALPFIRRMPQIWIERVQADGGTPEVALWFWIVALAGLAAAPLIEVAFRTLVDRQQTRVSEVRPTPRFWVAVIRFLAELASLDSSPEDRRQEESRNWGRCSGGEQVDDVLNSCVGAMVGGFEFAGRLVRGTGAMMKAAVGEGSAEPFVEEQKEQRHLDPFGCEPVGIAGAVAL